MYTYILKSVLRNKVKTGFCLVISRQYDIHQYRHSFYHNITEIYSTHIKKVYYIQKYDIYLFVEEIC